MANIIAVIWDCDKTLIDGYMQDPMFEEYGVDPKAFWQETDALPEKYLREQNVRVNPDTIYLNQFIRYARDGRFPGLNNEKLREFGKKQKFYPGIPEIFRSTEKLINDDPAYAEYGIRLEHYIISTGFSEVIRGSILMDYMKYIWGCELIEDEDAEGRRLISEIGYTIDNTTKTRALFEINKGIPFDKGISVNSSIPEENRRVHMNNMIYIADVRATYLLFLLSGRAGEQPSRFIRKETPGPWPRWKRCATRAGWICTPRPIIRKVLPHICGSWGRLKRSRTGSGTTSSIRSAVPCPEFRST